MNVREFEWFVSRLFASRASTVFCLEAGVNYSKEDYHVRWSIHKVVFGICSTKIVNPIIIVRNINALIILSAKLNDLEFSRKICFDSFICTPSLS